MQLKSAQVTNFKSVLDSTAFGIDHMTCLVGKNESGKTALLEALYKLNPVEAADATFQYVLEYPRQSLMEYEAAVMAGGSHGTVIRTEWMLDQDDVVAVGTVLGPNALTSHQVTISRGYSNKNLWILGIDEQAVVEFVLSNADLARADAAPLQKAPRYRS